MAEVKVMNLSWGACSLYQFYAVLHCKVHMWLPLSIGTLEMHNRVAEKLKVQYFDRNWSIKSQIFKCGHIHISHAFAQ